MKIPPVLTVGSFVFCSADCIEIFLPIRCKEILAEKLDFMIQLVTYSPGQKRKGMQQWSWTKYDYTILTDFTGQIREQWHFFVSLILNVRVTWSARYLLFAEKTFTSKEQVFVMELWLWFRNEQRLLPCKWLSFRKIAKGDC